jgi:hypothetical protein
MADHAASATPGAAKSGSVPPSAARSLRAADGVERAGPRRTAKQSRARFAAQHHQPRRTGDIPRAAIAASVGRTAHARGHGQRVTVDIRHAPTSAGKNVLQDMVSNDILTVEVSSRKGAKPRPFEISRHFGPQGPRFRELDAQARRDVSATGEATRRRDSGDGRPRRGREAGERFGR